MSIHKSPFAAYSGGKGGVCMEGVYDIFDGDTVIGTASISREGLYYRFDCECRPEKRGLFKICLLDENEKIILGTPIPEGHGFCLRTKLPIKRLRGQKPRFFINRGSEETGKFIPVAPDTPFLYLQELENAYFCIRDGVSGIVIRK